MNKNAQLLLGTVMYAVSRRGRRQVCYLGYSFEMEKERTGSTSWRCNQAKPLKCKARIIERFDMCGDPIYEIVRSEHNHEIITERRPRGSLKRCGVKSLLHVIE